MLTWFAETCPRFAATPTAKPATPPQHDGPSAKPAAVARDRRVAADFALVTAAPTRTAPALAPAPVQRQQLAVPARANHLLELDSGAGSECDDDFEQLEGIFESAAGASSDSGNSGSECDDDDYDSSPPRRLSSVQRVASRWKIRHSAASEIMLRFEVAQQMVAADFEPSAGARASTRRRHSMHAILATPPPPSSASPAADPGAGPRKFRFSKGTAAALRSRSTLDFAVSSPGFQHLARDFKLSHKCETRLAPIASACAEEAEECEALLRPGEGTCEGEPVTFATAAARGLQSSSFDLTGNLASGDKRRVAIEELEELMADGTRSFDEARVELVRRQMLRHGINPETGLLF